MKKQNGITLIALVITIIVLLILAGVSISAITGENGIIEKARQAKEETEAAQKKEEEDLQSVLDYINENEQVEENVKQDKLSKIYFNQRYTGIIKDNQNISIVFYEDGSMDIYSNNILAETISGDSSVFGENTVRIGEEVCEVSENGKEVSMSDSVTIKLEEGRGIYFNRIYKPQDTSNTIMVAFHQDGAVYSYMQTFVENGSEVDEDILVACPLESGVCSYSNNYIYMYQDGSSVVGTISDDGSEVIVGNTIYELIIEDIIFKYEIRNDILTSKAVVFDENNENIIVLSEFEFDGAKFEVDSISFQFRDYTNLKTAVIPTSIKYIDTGAFHGCDNLTDIYYVGTEEEWNTICVNNNNLSNVTIHYNYILE